MGGERIVDGGIREIHKEQVYINYCPNHDQETSCISSVLVPLQIWAVVDTALIHEYALRYKVSFPKIDCIVGITQYADA